MSNEKQLESLVYDAVPDSEDGHDVHVGGAADSGEEEALGVLTHSRQKSRSITCMHFGSTTRMLILVIHARDYIQYRGQERGGFMRAMVCIIVVPDSDCCIYILSVCQMASVLSIQFDMVPLVCSWIYESNGMHHGCPRIRMIFCLMSRDSASRDSALICSCWQDRR